MSLETALKAGLEDPRILENAPEVSFNFLGKFNDFKQLTDKIQETIAAQNYIKRYEIDPDMLPEEENLVHIFFYDQNDKLDCKLSFEKVKDETTNNITYLLPGARRNFIMFKDEPEHRDDRVLFFLNLMKNICTLNEEVQFGMNIKNVNVDVEVDYSNKQNCYTTYKSNFFNKTSIRESIRSFAKEHNLDLTDFDLIGQELIKEKINGVINYEKFQKLFSAVGNLGFSSEGLKMIYEIIKPEVVTLYPDPVKDSDIEYEKKLSNYLEKLYDNE